MTLPTALVYGGSAGLGYAILQIEDVFERALEAICPQVGAD